MNKHPLANCEECPLKDEPYVPSFGPEIADIVIVGEAPGLQETHKGEPFVGSSGKLLDEVLRHNGISREKAFLTNVCLCRPKSNAVPSKKAQDCCADRLHGEIVLRKPTKILALGATASSAIMGTKVKITSFRAGPPKSSSLYPEISIIPTVHPAACLRSPDYFPSLCADIEKVRGNVAIKWEPPSHRVYGPYDGIEAIKELLQGQYEFVVDIETAYEKDADYVQPGHYELTCVGVGFMAGKVCVFNQQAVHDPLFQSWLARLLQKGITGHNVKFDANGLRHIGPSKVDFDTLLAHYCIDERRGTHKLEYLSGEFLGSPNWKSMIKDFKAMPDVLGDTLHEYNAIDVSNTYDLRPILQAKLSPELHNLNGFLLDASNSLADIEYAGIGIDEEALDKLDEFVGHDKHLQELALEEFVANPRSHVQVKAYLESVGIEVANTQRKTLLELQKHLFRDDRRRFVDLMLDYRKVQKLYDTYVKGIRKRLFQGRINTSFLLHGTVTGRLSSRNPNLQNIPRDDKRIKSLFVADEGNIFVQADYNQIEYRVVCCEAKEERLKEVFDDPRRDIFAELAERIFGPNWTPAHRQIVKRVCHGSNYLMGPNTMSDQMNSDAELMGVSDRYDHGRAKRFQSQYFGMFPGIVVWQQEVSHQIFNDSADLVTPFGRHRRFWLITKENKVDIQHEGIAFKPQSIASDINLRALIRLHALGVQLRLTVHDSLMAECPKDQADDVAQLMKQVMLESAKEYSEYCKFAVEIQTGTSWGNLS